MITKSSPKAAPETLKISMMQEICESSSWQMISSNTNLESIGDKGIALLYFVQDSNGSSFFYYLS